MTVPVATPAAGATAANAAVNVSGSPTADVVVDVATVPLAAPRPTTCAAEADGLPARKLASPPYVAVIAWLPMASAAVVSVAWPEPSRFAVWSSVPPS